MKNLPNTGGDSFLRLRSGHALPIRLRSMFGVLWPVDIVAFLTPRLQDTKTHKGKTLKLGVYLFPGDIVVLLPPRLLGTKVHEE